MAWRFAFCLLLAYPVATVADAGTLKPKLAKLQASAKHASFLSKSPLALHTKAKAVRAPSVTELVAVAGPTVPPMAELQHVEAAPPALEIPVAHEADVVESSAAAKQLRTDLAQMKQLHQNVKTIEKTLQADVFLLRESATLVKVSTSASGRKSAQEQLKQAEGMVRDTKKMVKQSRLNAFESAHAALFEAQAARKAADALSAEASAQLKILEPREPAQETQDVAALQIPAKTSQAHAAKAAPKAPARLAQKDDDDSDDSDEDDKDDLAM
jgi:hypothetical protein